MHPQLDRNRFNPCEKLMDALEECHQQEFLKKALGSCNFEKEELSKCLHYTRLNDAKERIKESKERQKNREKKIREREEALYGKNGYLKQVVTEEMKRK